MGQGWTPEPLLAGLLSMLSTLWIRLWRQLPGQSSEPWRAAFLFLASFSCPQPLQRPGHPDLPQSPGTLGVWEHRHLAEGLVSPSLQLPRGTSFPFCLSCCWSEKAGIQQVRRLLELCGSSSLPCLMVRLSLKSLQNGEGSWAGDPFHRSAL